MEPKLGDNWPDIQFFYSHLSHQIEREDGLINNRLNWFLTSEGLLFAAFAVSVTAEQGALNTKIAALLLCVLPLMGLVISFFALQGVRAAERALISLKSAWRSQVTAYLQEKGVEPRRAGVPDEEAGYDEHIAFPRPYGDEAAWKGGHSFNKSLPISIGAAWFVIFLCVLISFV